MRQNRRGKLQEMARLIQTPLYDVRLIMDTNFQKKKKKNTRKEGIRELLSPLLPLPVVL